MIFGNRARQRAQPVARPITTLADNARGVQATSNGPETPVIDVSAMRRALDHAAWRDPQHEKRKSEDVFKAVRTLERTAACVDLASERIADALDALVQGKATQDPVMRGLLTSRFEELLDSLERIAIMAQDGNINLLAGIGDIAGHGQRGFAVARLHNSLCLDIGSTGFRYVLPPIDIRRGQQALNIPAFENAFEDKAEVYQLETAVLQAQGKLRQFGVRLAQDAVMLVSIAKANDASQAEPADSKQDQPQSDGENPA
jgi:hypothetical protein